MKTLKLENGDLVMEEQPFSNYHEFNGWTSITGIDAVVQRVRNRLKLFAGEWFLDKSEGIDWFGIFEKPFSMRRMKSEMRKALEKDESIEIIKKIEITPDFSERKLVMDISLIINSEIVTITEEINE